MKSEAGTRGNWRWAIPPLILGAAILLYLAAANPLYVKYKSGLIKDVYREICQINLSNMEEEDTEFLQDAAMRRLELLIADEAGKVLFSSRPFGSREWLEQTITKRKQEYRENPTITVRRSNRYDVIRLKGLAVQDGKEHYIYVKYEVRGMVEILPATGMYLAFVWLILAVVCYLLSRRERMREALWKESDQEGQERLYEAQKEYVANISHELKTPLAVISGQVEMLQELGDEVDKDYYFNSIREEIGKMSDMVGDLLGLTIIDHKMAKMEMSSLDLSEMMEYMVLKYDALFRKNKIKVRTDVQKSCRVQANRMYLEEAVNNYMMNAFQHTSQGKHISIQLVKEEKDAVIRIFNEGTCISREDMEHIWKSFYMAQKGKKTETADGNGSGRSNIGLGLYRVKTIIGQHGGSCGAQNEKNGVTFWIRLPLEEK